jgi:hypothetical protein
VPEEALQALQALPFKPRLAYLHPNTGSRQASHRLVSPTPRSSQPETHTNMRMKTEGLRLCLSIATCRAAPVQPTATLQVRVPQPTSLRHKKVNSELRTYASHSKPASSALGGLVLACVAPRDMRMATGITGAIAQFLTQHRPSLGEHCASYGPICADQHEGVICVGRGLQH